MEGGTTERVPARATGTVGEDVSDTDSFIDEVSEEVRREKLFGYLKRYGWIGVVLVFALVGGATYNEWRKATAQAEAEARGDALITALEIEDPDSRIAALESMEVPGAAAPVVALLTAAEQERQGDLEAAVSTLDALAADGAVPAEYRDLAAFKSLMMSAGIVEDETRRAGFETLAAPGEPYRLLAREQLVLLDLTVGDEAAALAGLAEIVEDAEVSSGLRDRALSLIVALGGEPDAATAEDQ